MPSPKLPRWLARHPFHKKVMFGSVFATAVAVCLSVVGLIDVQYNHYRKQADGQYAQIADMLANNLGAAVIFDDKAAAASILKSAQAVPNVRWIDVHRADGAAIASYSPKGESDHQIEAQRAAATATWPGYWPGASERPVVRTVPIKIDATTVGELAIGYQYRSLWSIALETLPAATIIFILCVTMGFYIAHLVRRLVSQPFGRMQRAMQRVRESGDLDARVDLTEDPDFDELIISYNAMLEDLKAHRTELSATLDQLSDARDAAEAASIAKSAFLANMSHELRTPLNAIIGYAEVLRDDLDRAGLLRSVEDVSWIHRSSHQLLDMINSLLDLSKIEAGHMELDVHSFDLAALVSEVEATLQPLADRQGNTLAINFDRSLGMARNDSTKLRQCLLNLGSNACKFTKDGFVELAVRGDGAELVFEVSDTGIGMTDEDLQRLFQPFVQSDSSTTRRFGGTGLGLALVERFVTMLGGTIEVSSEPGFGSTFVLRVPRDLAPDAAEAPQLPAITADGAGPDRHERRDRPVALVVEDDPSSAELLRRMLERNGYHPVVARNGEAGMELAASELPDVILLDLGMPKLDGWEMLERLAQNDVLSKIPTVVVSVDDRRRRSIEKGASEHLVKPVDVDELDAVLKLYSQRHSGKVLLVEDDDATARLYENGLRQYGFETVRAVNGEDAAQALAEQDFGLVVTDLMMPKVDGFSLIRQIERFNGKDRPPVVVVTSRALSPDERRFLDDSTSAVCLKSGLTPRELVSTVSRILRT